MTPPSSTDMVGLGSITGSGGGGGIHGGTDITSNGLLMEQDEGIVLQDSLASLQMLCRRRAPLYQDNKVSSYVTKNSLFWCLF